MTGNGFIDMTGRRYGRLSVIELGGRSGDGKPKWRCRCDCGSVVEVLGGLMRNGMTRSCGCLRRETLSRVKGKHHMCRTSEYGSWRSMKYRCYVPTSQDYSEYGGRGITICDAWRDSFEAFLADMGSCPPKHTIDRIDNSRGYEPGNCRWANGYTQARNTRRNRLIEHAGRSLTSAEWAEITGLRRTAIEKRLKRGWTVDRALSQPAPTRGRLTPDAAPAPAW